MTIANAPDIIPALPELFLAIIIMALMMMGVFHKNGGIEDIKASRLISLLSVISLLLAVMLVWTLSGGRLVTFAGMFVSDTFAVYCKVLVLIGSALAIVLYLSTLGESSLLAQETVNIRGRVVNGTEGAALPAELNVLMLITGPDGILGGTGQTMSDSQGRFIFEGVPVREGDIYTISVEHMSVFYGTSLDGGGLADELLLTVYEPTQDASIIRVERQVMVIAAVDMVAMASDGKHMG